MTSTRGRSGSWGLAREGPQSRDKGFGYCPVCAVTSPKAGKEAHCPALNMNWPHEAVSQLSSCWGLLPVWSLQEARGQLPLTRTFAQTPKYQAHLYLCLIPHFRKAPTEGMKVSKRPEASSPALLHRNESDDLMRLAGRLCGRLGYTESGVALLVILSPLL